MHACMDGYYKLDESMSKIKLTSITKVMKGALSVSKSKTGEIICRDNKLERERLKPKLVQVRREREFACVENEYKKRLFSRKHKKTLYLTLRDPPNVKYLKNRYKKLRDSIRERAKTMELQSRNKPSTHTEDCTALDKEYEEQDNAPRDTFVSSRDYAGYKERGQESESNSGEESSDSNKGDGVQTSEARRVDTRLLTKTERDLIRDSRLENKKKELANCPPSSLHRARPSLWREQTFDMSGIQGMLQLQREQQEQMVIRIKLERINTQKEIRRRLTEQKYSTGLERVGRVYTPSSASGSRLSSPSAPIIKRPRQTTNTASFSDKQDQAAGTLPNIGGHFVDRKYSHEREPEVEVQTQERALKSRSVSFVKGC